MLIFALLTTISAASPRLASLGFTQVNLTDELAASLSETFALRLVQSGEVRVITKKDVTAFIGVERQRALLGCSDQSTSCMSELVGALGADGIIAGEIALVGKTYQLTIKILKANDAKPVFLYLKRVSTEDEVLDELDRAAKLAVEQLASSLRAPGPSGEVGQSGTARPLARLLPALAGGVLGAVGAGLLVLSKNNYDLLDDPANWPLPDAMGLVSSGSSQQIAGLALVGVAAAALVAGALWYLLGGTSR